MGPGPAWLGWDRARALYTYKKQFICYCNSLLYDYNVFTTISDFIDHILKKLSKCKTNKNNIVYKIPLEDRKLILCGKSLDKSKPFHKLVKKIYQHPRIHFV